MFNISQLIGIDIEAKAWDKPPGLPYFMYETYAFYKAFIDDAECIIAELKVETPATHGLVTHFKTIINTLKLPVVLKLNGISRKRKKELIAARIPFITPEQVYIPFIGMFLQDKMYIEPKAKEKFMPSAQLLLFSYLYQNNNRMQTNPIAEKIGVTPMQITRAVRQLQRLNMIDVSKEGRQLVISGKLPHKELFEYAANYLIDPVHEVLYMERCKKITSIPHAGFSAISEMTMLSDSDVPTYAYYNKKERLSGEYGLSNRDKQVRVEIWKYTPNALSTNKKCADPLSVIVSIKDEWNDPRVEEAINTIQNKIWE
ncbi:MAG: hypothetical protein LBD23_04455 [Oscillospiraceae bacterium]|jgi:hypothetical protein|nr:hypothetical protein [Oscillospiraceae bacterium]